VTPSFACATRAWIRFPAAAREILDDDVRQRIARLKCNTEDWVSVHRHRASTGHENHGHHDVGVARPLSKDQPLEVIRRLQDQTGGFTAFIPWSFQPGTPPSAAALGRSDFGRVFESPGYLPPLSR